MQSASKILQAAALAAVNFAHLSHAQEWSSDLAGELGGETTTENEIQWGDIANFTETIDIDDNNTAQNGTGKNNCFQVSQIKGNDDDANFVSDLSKLKASFLDGMKMTRLRMCGTELVFTGVQGFISDGAQTIALTPIGSQF